MGNHASIDNTTDHQLSYGTWNSYSVTVRRDYYGEIQEVERIIEGENFERAVRYFNNQSLFWRVVRRNI